MFLHLSEQIKLNLSTRAVAGLGGGEGAEGGEGEGGTPPSSIVSTEPANTQAVDELKRAFELVETSSPGLSDLFMQKIIVHLQQR